MFSDVFLDDKKSVKLRNKTWNMNEWFFTVFLQLLKLKKGFCQTLRTKQRYSRSCLRNGGYCSNCVMFLFYPSYVQVFFHEFPSVSLSQGEISRWKMSQKVEIAEATQEKKQVEQGSGY